MTTTMHTHPSVPRVSRGKRDESRSATQLAHPLSQSTASIGLQITHE